MRLSSQFKHWSNRNYYIDLSVFFSRTYYTVCSYAVVHSFRPFFFSPDRGARRIIVALHSHHVHCKLDSFRCGPKGINNSSHKKYKVICVPTHGPQGAWKTNVFFSLWLIEFQLIWNIKIQLYSRYREMSANRTREGKKKRWLSVRNTGGAAEG